MTVTDPLTEHPHRRGARTCFGLLLAVLLPLAACADGPDAAGGETAEEATPRYGGTVVVAGPSDLGPPNALLAAERYTQEVNRYALFTTLVRYDEQLEFEPYLAESWEMLGDTGVVFHLREDIDWHDGERTTAYDVAFTYERAKDPDTGYPNASYFAQWDAVEVLDSFTVSFRFEPHPDPLAGWAFTPIMPAHLLESIPPAELRQADFNQAPVGNGPFRFVSHTPNDRWVFEANEDFPAALGGRPYVDRFIWRVVPENTAQVTELLAGDADLIISPRAEQVLDLDERPGVRAIVRPARQYNFVGWNGARAPFGDARVRRALSLAIDRQEIIDALRSGYGTLAIGPIAPYHWAYNSAVEPLPHDAAAARSLLDEAGFSDRDGDGVVEGPDGESLEFALKIPAANQFNSDMAEMIRADLAEVGVRMTTQPTEATTLIEDISSPERRFDAVLLAWEADFRINLRDQFHSAALGGPFQLASYSNQEVDRLLDETARLIDREQAAPLLARLQEIMREEQPWTFLYYYPDLHLARERVRGTEMDIRGTMVGLANWWVADGSAN